jgi:hypothetical protein
MDPKIPPIIVPESGGFSAKSEFPLTFEDVPRNPVAWVLGVVILLILAFNMYAQFQMDINPSKPTEKARLAALAKAKEIVRTSISYNRARNLLVGSSAQDNLIPVPDAIQKATDTESAAIRVAINRFNRSSVKESDIALLEKSADPSQVLLAQITKSRPGVAGWSPRKEDIPLAQRLSESGLANQIVRFDILDPKGDKGLANKYFPVLPGIVQFVVFLCILGAGLLGFLQLLGRIKLKTIGKPLGTGIPLANISRGQADRLILLGSVTIAIYIAATLALTSNGMPQVFAPFAGAIPVGAAILMVNGGMVSPRITLQKFGLSLKGFWHQAREGVQNWFLTLTFMIPALIVSAAIKTVVGQGGDHPAASGLTTDNPPMLVATLIGAVVLAPIWEEIVFRGMLFPALTKYTKSLVWAAVISGFVFAAPHPQGIVGLPVLVTLAIGLCYATYRSSSLISAIVQHALNNALVLAVALLS